MIGLAVGALAAALGVQPEKASQLLKGSAHLVGLSVLDVSRLLVTELDHGGTHR